MVIDDRRLRPTENNLTLVRLVLASAVIWTHSFWRMTGRSGVDELSPFLGAPISSVAVDGFFFLSGFLVYGSLLRRGSVVDFAAARLARLWPGLAVAVLLIAVAGAFLTSAPGLAYLGGSTARFILGNLSLTTGGYALTGIECGGEPCNVNGSLWTITWEVRCYLLLAIALLVGLARPSAMKRVVLPASLAFAVGMHLPGADDFVRARAGAGALYNLELFDRLWSMFALGVAAWLFRSRIRLSWLVLLALLTLLIVTEAFSPIPHVGGLFTAYAVLCAGFLSARRVVVSGRWPDYSYGMYIYAFPAMMAAAALLPIRSHPVLALANLLLTLPLAALSWHFVEKPSLELVRSRMPRRRGAESRPTSDALAQRNG